MKFIKNIRQYLNNAWQDLNLTDEVVDLNIKNGEGTDSIVLKYSGTVDEIHFENTNSGKSAAIFGESNSNKGNNSTLVGCNLKNEYNDNAIIGGLFNDENQKDALLEIGNGTSDTERSNAFVVLKDGRAKVQTKPTENDDVVRKLELDSAISTIIGTAPENLNTLQEIADWIQDDESGATKLIEEVREIESNYVTTNTVQVISGKKIFTGSDAGTIEAGTTIGDIIRVSDDLGNISSVYPNGLTVQSGSNTTKYSQGSILNTRNASQFIRYNIPDDDEGGTLATQEWVSNSNYAKLDSDNTFNGDIIINDKKLNEITWSNDLITNQTDLSGMTVKFDTSLTAEELVSAGAPDLPSGESSVSLKTSGGYTFLIGSHSINYYSPSLAPVSIWDSQSWLSETVLPADFGYFTGGITDVVVNILNTIAPKTKASTFQMGGMTLSAPTESGKIATQEWVDSHPIGTKNIVWSEDLITNQTDLSGMTIKFDTTKTDLLSSDGTSYKLFETTGAAYLLVNSDGGLYYLDKTNGISITVANGGSSLSWQVSEITLSNNVGAIYAFGINIMDGESTYATTAINVLNTIAPDGILIPGGLNTKEYIDYKVGSISVDDSNYAKLDSNNTFSGNITAKGTVGGESGSAAKYADGTCIGKDKVVVSHGFYNDSSDESTLYASKHTEVLPGEIHLADSEVGYDLSLTQQDLYNGTAAIEYKTISNTYRYYLPYMTNSYGKGEILATKEWVNENALVDDTAYAKLNGTNTFTGFTEFYCSESSSGVRFSGQPVHSYTTFQFYAESPDSNQTSDPDIGDTNSGVGIDLLSETSYDRTKYRNGCIEVASGTYSTSKKEGKLLLPAEDGTVATREFVKSNKAIELASPYAWNYLRLNQTDISGMTIRFDTSTVLSSTTDSGKGQFHLDDGTAYLLSSTGYTLFVDNNGAIILRRQDTSTVDTLYSGGAWLKDSIKLPDDFGYIATFCANPSVDSESVEDALEVMAPEGVGFVETIATQEWVRSGFGGGKLYCHSVTFDSGIRLCIYSPSSTQLFTTADSSIMPALMTNIVTSGQTGYLYVAASPASSGVTIYRLSTNGTVSPTDVTSITSYSILEWS